MLAVRRSVLVSVQLNTGEITAAIAEGTPENVSQPPELTMLNDAKIGGRLSGGSPAARDLVQRRTNCAATISRSQVDIVIPIRKRTSVVHPVRKPGSPCRRRNNLRSPHWQWERWRAAIRTFMPHEFTDGIAAVIARADA